MAEFRGGLNFLLLNSELKTQNCMMIEKGKQFVSEANQELKRVTWPAKKHVAASTWVVIGLVFVISILLGLVDFVLARLVKMILG